MAKINVAKNTDEEKLNEFISQISIYSNAQSKVSSADLRSRNEQLIKLKAVSESTLSPTGKNGFLNALRVNSILYSEKSCCKNEDQQ